MPQFRRNTSQKVVAAVTVKPAGINFEAEIFLGPDEMTKVTTSGRVPFISTGASQNVQLLVVMPAWPGTYKAFLDVYASGQPLAQHLLSEDVQIF